MISFQFSHDSRKTMIESLKDTFDEWISHIEINRELFSVVIEFKEPAEGLWGTLLINYENQILFKVFFYQKYDRTSDGRLLIRGAITVKRKNMAGEVFNMENELCLHIDDRFEVNYNGYSNVNLCKALMDVLPLREEDKIQDICEAFDIKEEDIAFDTYQKYYVVKRSIKELDYPIGNSPKYIYKYISLNVLISMLNNKTFRMNSITAQSDRTESLYLGDILSDEFKDIITRYKNLHKERHYLISSFTTSYDDDKMWMEYGDKGQGVMLGFEVIGDSFLRKVQYVDKQKNTLMRYREITEHLKAKGIRIHFACKDGKHRFVKDAVYEKEKEWRLLMDYTGELSYTLYRDQKDNRFAYYKDFHFRGNELPELNLRLLDVVVGPKLCQGTNDFVDIAYAVRSTLGVKVVNRSECIMDKLN